MAGIINLPIVSKFDSKGINEAKSGLDGLQSGMKAFGAVAAVAFAAVAAGAVAFGVESLKAAAHSESVARGLEQMTKNSGAFGSTAGEIKKVAAEIMGYTKNLSNLIGVDDEILNSIVRGWMAVPELAGKGVKGLENMVKVVADVAAGTGKDVQAIGMAFIKVAGDETTALGKLLRQGIVFTDAQKAMYQSILDTSGGVAAQDYLIKTLGETYAGAAKAAANPFDVLQQNVKNLQEEVGVYLLPALDLFIKKLQEFISTHGPGMEVAFQKIGDFAMGLVDAFFAFSGWVDDNPDIWNTIVAGLGIVTAAIWVMNAALDANPVGAVILAITGLIALTVGIVMNWNQIIGAAAGGFQILWGGILGTAEGAINGIIDGFNKVIDVINALGGSLARIGKVDFGALAMIKAGSTTQAAAGIAGRKSYSTNMGGGGASPRPFAVGGIVTQPVNALVGEAGPEAIIPLDKLASMGFGGGGNSYTINVSAMNADAKVGEMIVSAIKRYERTSGSVFASA